MSWITPSFNAGDFVASPSGLWTVREEDVITYEYKIVEGEATKSPALKLGVIQLILQSLPRCRSA